jgi:hypothetical protein
MADVITTRKPWVLLVFALLVINTIVALGAVAGMETPIDLFQTDTTYLPIDAQVAPAAEPGVVAPINIAAFMLLVLDIIMLWGLSQGHTWVWWMLTFTSIFAVITGIFGFIAGQPIAVITFVLNIVLIAALLKKEVVTEFNPNLHILPKDGVW